MELWKKCFISILGLWFAVIKNSEGQDSLCSDGGEATKDQCCICTRAPVTRFCSGGCPANHFQAAQTIPADQCQAPITTTLTTTIGITTTTAANTYVDSNTSQGTTDASNDSGFNSTSSTTVASKAVGSNTTSRTTPSKDGGSNDTSRTTTANEDRSSSTTSGVWDATPTPYNVTCLPCDVACASCVGAGPENCTSCAEGYQGEDTSVKTCVAEEGGGISTAVVVVLSILLPAVVVVTVVLVLRHRRRRRKQEDSGIRRRDAAAKEVSEEETVSIGREPDGQISLYVSDPTVKNSAPGSRPLTFPVKREEASREHIPGFKPLTQRRLKPTSYENVSYISSEESLDTGVQRESKNSRHIQPNSGQARAFESLQSKAVTKGPAELAIADDYACVSEDRHLGIVTTVSIEDTDCLGEANPGNAVYENTSILSSSFTCDVYTTINLGGEYGNVCHTSREVPAADDEELLILETGPYNSLHHNALGFYPGPTKEAETVFVDQEDYANLQSAVSKSTQTDEHVEVDHDEQSPSGNIVDQLSPGSETAGTSVTGMTHLEVVDESSLSGSSVHMTGSTSTSEGNRNSNPEDTDNLYVLINELSLVKEERTHDYVNLTPIFVSVSTSTQTVEDDTARPLFSQKWQFSKQFNCEGGVLQGEHSDVQLKVPACAVQNGEFVIIHGSVCTNLSDVHTRFKLGEEEFISSPVVEYDAGHNFKFQNPVCVVLPHFLPATFSKSHVKVYQFNTDDYGNWKLQPLEYQSGIRFGETAGRRLPTEETGVYCFAENDEIHILTDHFTGYFCTSCNMWFPLPELCLQLSAWHSRRTQGRRLVNLLLKVWDGRLKIRDFREAQELERHLNPPAANSARCVFSDRKTLPALQRDVDVSRVSIAACLELSEIDEQFWMHCVRRNGELLHPIQNVIKLDQLVHCKCRSGFPLRIDWDLTDRNHDACSDIFECVVDVWYVLSANQSDGSPLRPTTFHPNFALPPPLRETGLNNEAQDTSQQKHDSDVGNAVNNLVDDKEKPPQNGQQTLMISEATNVYVYNAPPSGKEEEGMKKEGTTVRSNQSEDTSRSRSAVAQGGARELTISGAPLAGESIAEPSETAVGRDHSPGRRTDSGSDETLLKVPEQVSEALQSPNQGASEDVQATGGEFASPSAEGSAAYEEISDRPLSHGSETIRQKDPDGARRED